MDVIQFIKTQLNEVADKIPVEWDRYTCSGNIVYNLYGWIRRSDGERDFVVLQVFLTGGEPILSYITSSAKYSRTIAEIIFKESAGHTDCIKISELQ
jgi:hypothetical protein